MTSVTCPSEEQLVALAADGLGAAALESHVRDCPACKSRLARLRSEVEGLREALTGTLDIPAAGSGGATTAPPGGAIPIGRPPQMIGKYRVVCSLGVGGQGQVFRAWDADLAKDVVIKLSLQPLPPDGQARAGLGNEGRLLAALDHPGLARVYYLGVHRYAPDDVPGHEAEFAFLVMEYIRGRNLRQYAEQSHPSPQASAAIVAKVARALAAAHRRGAVHQDLKPQNILIDETGQPRVIDFGLGRIEQAWSESVRPLGGTVSYMPPEQARVYRDAPRQDAAGGDHADGGAGTASDVFSLGAVLYFMLTGRSPYSGGPFDTLLDRACKCDWDRAPLRAAKAPKLAAIVERAMAFSPRDRYPDADALAGDLERYLGRPQKIRGAAAFAVAVAFLLMLAGAGWRWGRGRARAVAPPAAAAVAWMVPAPEATWDNQGDYTIVRVSQLHVQNAAGRPLLLRAALRPADREPAAEIVHADYPFTPRDDDASLENIKIPLPRKPLGVRPGESRAFRYTLDLLDSATMSPVGSAATAGEARIAELPIARIERLRVPFVATQLGDIFINVSPEFSVQSETESIFEVYVHAYGDDPERTPILKNGRPVEFKQEVRSSSGKVAVKVPIRAEDLYPALGADVWGDVWLTARVYDSQNRRWAQDEQSGMVWEKVRVLKVRQGTTQPAAPDSSG